MYMVSRPYARSPISCMLCSCLNLQYFTTSYGILKIIQIVLGSICQSILLLNGTKYIPTIGTSYESFLTTVAGCLMTTTVISVSYLLSKSTEVIVRSSLFGCRQRHYKKYNSGTPKHQKLILLTYGLIVLEIIFGLFASICYFGSSSLLTVAVYMIVYPIFMTLPFVTYLFSALILAYILGFVLGTLYTLDAYWAFKYYKGFL